MTIADTNITVDEVTGLKERLNLEMGANYELSQKYTRLLELAYRAVISCRFKEFRTDEVTALACEIGIDTPATG